MNNKAHNTTHHVGSHPLIEPNVSGIANAKIARGTDLQVVKTQTAKIKPNVDKNIAKPIALGMLKLVNAASNRSKPTPR